MDESTVGDAVRSTAVATTHPSVAGVAVKLPPNRYTQQQAISALAVTGGINRRPAAPRFADANDAYAEIALNLGEQALQAALDQAHVKPSQVDIVFLTTVTGLALPALADGLRTRVGLRGDVECVGPGVAHMHDHLCACPDQVAALLAVELCSLTIQRVGNCATDLVVTNLLGDGAAAVIAKGAHRSEAGSTVPRVLATRRRIYPDTEEVAGWKIGGDGFRMVLNVDVATITEKYLRDDVCAFLADHGLTQRDVTSWICHPGGPRLIDAVQNVLGLPGDALAPARKSLRDNGVLSSVSVLDVLRASMTDPPPPGSIGLMIAMGPALSAELVLLAW